MTDSYIHTVAIMGTVVTIQVVGHGADGLERQEREAGVARAVAWFDAINERCNRFDPASELRRMSTNIGVPVPASPLLFQAVEFALAVAAETRGSFDPTIGLQLEALGFDREYRTGQMVRSVSCVSRFR